MTSQLDNTRWAESRRIVKRIVITGTLVLQTPTQLSNGDADGAADMSLLRDPLEGKALLTGTSIAGALRSYLRRREQRHAENDSRQSKTAKLFGPHSQRTENDPADPGDSEQSYLITHDALGDVPQTELRDGVAIDYKTRTAEDKKKYDLELLVAGTLFPLRFELLIPAGETIEDELKEACAVALSGLENGDIRLGARKRRGFGKCTLSEDGWTLVEYDLTQPVGLLAWLEHSRQDAQTGNTIAGLLDKTVQADKLDHRNLFTLKATFSLDSSLLIRAASDDPRAPDMVHLKSLRNGKMVPVVSGTSIAGVLRARALRIANTVGNEALAKALVDDLFGKRIESTEDDPVASRLWVEETTIKDPEHPLELVVTRVKIDRFTGGSFPGALFSQQPVFGRPQTEIDVCLRVENPTDADIGLLLLLLKDLWTRDLPLGGEASVGRGRLSGKRASLARTHTEQEREMWSIHQEDNRLNISGDRDALQGFVDRFVSAVTGTRTEEASRGAV